MELIELNNLVDTIAINRKLKDNLQQQVDLKRKVFEESIEGMTTEILELKKDIEDTQLSVLEELKKSGNKNWKTEKATVSRKSSISYSVTDKGKVLNYLRDKDLLGEYTTVELKTSIKGIFEQEDVPGVEKTEKEFISVIVK